MATTVARLEAILSANTESFDRKMAESEGRMHKVGRGAAIAGAAIVGGLAVGLEHSVKAAVSAQASQARLEQAFKTSHLAVSVYTKRIDEAETASRKLGFTDEDTRDSLARLITATHNYGSARKELTIAEDIARFKSVSLTDATKMLTMAQTGSQRAAKQLGITVPTVTSAMDALKAAHSKVTTVTHVHGAATQKLTTDTVFFASAQGKAESAQAKLTDKLKTGQLVIEETRQHVQGQGKAFADTAAGGMAQFHAQLDHLQVSIGSGLLPILVSLTTKLADLMSWFARNTGVAKLLLVGLGALGVTLLTISAATKAYAAAQAIARAATVAWTAAQWLLNAALTANPIGVVIVALAALGVALVVAYKKVAFFRDGVNAAWSWIKDHWPLLVGIMGGPIGIVVEQIITRRDQIVNVFKNLPGDIAAAFTAGTDLVKNAIVGLFHKVIHWVKSALGIASPSSVFYEIGKNSILGFIHGVGSMAGVLKDYVVHTAENAVKSLPGKIGGAVGSLGLGGSAPAANTGHLVPQVLRAIVYARGHGWHGEITSGYRTYAQQAALYQNYLHGGPLAARPGTSSHETGQAIDVTDYGTFGRIMASAPGIDRLFNRLGAADPVHFSVSGYQYGGTVPGPVGAAQLAVVHGGERITPPGQVGGPTINFNGPVSDKESFAAIVYDVLNEYQNRNGRPMGGGF